MKAKIAARDRHRASAKVQPPTVEAVRNTILKLTDMVERKNADVEYLQEKVRRIRQGSRNSTSRSLGMTPGRESTPPVDKGATPVRKPVSLARGSKLTAPIPLLAIMEADDIHDIREAHCRKRETMKRLRGALEVRASRRAAN